MIRVSKCLQHCDIHLPTSVYPVLAKTGFSESHGYAKFRVVGIENQQFLQFYVPERGVCTPHCAPVPFSPVSVTPPVDENQRQSTRRGESGV